MSHYQSVLLEREDNRVMVDRKEIEKLYKSEGFDYRPTSQDANETEFYDRAADKPIKRRLDVVVRTRVPGGKEYILYQETLRVEDELNNRLYFSPSELQGKFQEPVFRYEWSTDKRKKEAVEIVGHRTKYEHPFSKQEMQKILDRNTEEDANTKFILVLSGNQRHTGFTADEFLNRSFDELVTKVTTGEYPKAAEKKSEIKEIKKGLIAEVEKDSEEESRYAEIVRAVDEETHATEEAAASQPQQPKKSFGKRHR